MIPDILIEGTFDDQVTLIGGRKGSRMKSVQSAYIYRGLHLKQGMPTCAYENTSSGAVMLVSEWDIRRGMTIGRQMCNFMIKIQPLDVQSMSMGRTKPLRGRRTKRSCDSASYRSTCV